MRCAARFAAAILCLISFPLQSWGTIAVPIPKEGEGYSITKKDSGHMAPSGYEGRTDISEQTAIGNTSATQGKRVYTRFELGNEIKTCPLADGKAEGKGVFSMSVDYTDAQANGTSKLHIEMKAEANYKGQVGDDAFLINPVKAEVDYTFNQTGTFKDPSGAIAVLAPTHITQHVTVPVVVAKDMNPPSFGAFSGGDPTQGHYGEALGAGAALGYWAGFYYSVAQTKWLQGECAQVVFSPASHSVQPPLGTETTVKVEVKTKGGETSKAMIAVRPRTDGSSVNPGAGPSDVGAPFKLTYRAPEKKVASAGFEVTGRSRAGIATGEWRTDLGTGWSGQISCQTQLTDGGQSELQTYSASETNRITIDVKNGVGSGTGFAEATSYGQSRQKALRGGAITLINSNGYRSSGSVEGTSTATLNINVNEAKGTYSIGANLDKAIEGTMNTSTCGRETCQDSSKPFYVAPCFSSRMAGSLSDPNHLSGSFSESSPAGMYGKGKLTTTVNWDLGRLGRTTK